MKQTQPTATKSTVSVTQRCTCSACGSRQLVPLIDLPAFPLTGIYVEQQRLADFAAFDQALLRCEECGHAQLRATIDPAYLYQETYSHRSSLSPIATRGNDFLHEFILSLSEGRPFDSIVEVGCNDLYLLRKLAGRGQHRLGFDPIWRDSDAREVDGISVSGKYIEEICPESDIPVRPDLVVSANTLEHVNDPLVSLRPIFEWAKPGALFVVEVPSFDTLVRTARFDQVFHQHLNYYSLASFNSMIRALGGEYVAHRHNFDYWLGTLVIAFRKPTASITKASSPCMAPSAAEIATHYGLFRSQIQSVKGLMDACRRFGTPLVGYGAAQMVPTIAYHMESDLSFLEGILDENEGRVGRFQPGLKVPILKASDFPTLNGHGVFITAPDSARPILSKLMAKHPRYVFYPFNIF